MSNSAPLTEEEIVILRQARRGAHSIAWLVSFLLIGFGMFTMIVHNLETSIAKAGGVIVCLMTAWVTMLFVAGLSKIVANMLLFTFSGKQRQLKAYEKSMAD